jgi:hypothetical protein
MRSKLFFLCAAALITGASATAIADDGTKVLKRMNGGSTGNQLTVLPEDVGQHVSEAEHAFTDMMKFYVPMQAASGATGDDLGELATEKADPRDYYDIGEEWVETIPVAKPLVNVFIYGPAVGVEETPFAHSFMDTFAAVSLDDGMTWKTTNLSQSADQSSFNLDEDHVPSGRGHTHPLPDSHDVALRKYGETAWHGPGYETPYTNACTKCHGSTLEGGRHAQSCFNCHNEAEWERDPTLVGPVVDQAEWDAKKAKKGKLKVKGGNADAKAAVTIINGVTGDVIRSKKAKKDGDFKINAKIAADAVPCTVAAVVDGVTSAPAAVEDAPETCVGPPEVGPDLTNYPGGSYNVFHATAGNKTLVAWPSRFCQQGKPSYSFAYRADPLEDPEDELVIKRNALAEYLGIDVTKDLYLTDLFGVAGQQGSIDFADEGYAQAGVVPFGCVWTARGVLLPGDDPRTEELEESHMVWTKPERLTSGRRDPNRIESRQSPGPGSS